MNRRLPGMLLSLLLLVGGCAAAGGTPEPGPSAAPPPFADCAGLTGSLTVAASAPPGPTEDPRNPLVGRSLPDVRLPCFTGGQPVSLGQLRGPALVNLWGSYCAPCRKELPAFQRLVDRTGGRLRVVGVNSRDDRGRAESVGEDFGVRFPMLYDRDEQVRLALALNVLPITLFVDDDGRIRHVDTSGALDDARLVTLLREHLGLAVPA